MSKKKRVKKEQYFAEKMMDDSWVQYGRVLDRVEEVLNEENPPIPVVMAVCNMIMLKVVQHGTFTKRDIMKVLNSTLDMADNDSLTTLQ